MPHNRLIPFLCCILFLGGIQIGAAQKVFKISSQAPERSIWGKALIKIARNVSAATDGEVEFKIFHGGVQGDEQTVLDFLKHSTELSLIEPGPADTAK